MRRDIGPARDELFEIRPDRLDPGLLQHDFRQPDPIRIGALARQRPPRQPAAMPVVPVEQQRGTREARLGGVPLTRPAFAIAGEFMTII